MKWLEVLHLRTAEQESDRLMHLLRQLITEIRVHRTCREIKMFKRALLETDVCLHLYHDTDSIETTGSLVGLHLARELKAFGMLNHTVWMVDEAGSSGGGISSAEQDNWM